MKKIRVLFEAGPMVDIKKTGVGYYVDHLVSNLGALSESNLELTGYFFDLFNRNNKQPPHKNGLKYKKIWLVPGKLLSLCRRLGFQPFLELFIWRKADIVLFTNYVALPRLQKTKNALVIYDLSFMDHPEYMQEVNLSYLKRFSPKSIENSDLIITISEFTKDRINHYFPELSAEIVVTPIPPVSIENTSVELQPTLLEKGIHAKQYILYLGTVEPRKNIQNLVLAYGQLPKIVQESYALVLAGGKGWKDEEILLTIKKLQSKGLTIIQTGYISDEEKAALYSNAACFVLPSHYEGFGMPILEAMQYHIPIAVSDIPVFHEVAGDAVLYFDKDNPEVIAKSLNQILTDTQLQQSLRSKGDAQLKTFSWQKNAKIVQDAINSVVE